MERFVALDSIAAPMPLINIDTDMIIPKQFLKTIKRTGLGENLFDEMRFDSNGNEIKDFILNQDNYKNSNIIVAGENFGCGSSREHAPWALVDFGIRCIIAPSFADIFYNNSFKNSILPIILSQDKVDALMNDAKSNLRFSVDLENQKVKTDNNEFSFEIDSFRKHCLLNGLDDISLTLENEAKIQEFEQKNKSQTPWLYA